MLDKVWALIGGLSFVGQWTQLLYLMDLVAAPTIVGVAMGLTVLVAQRDSSEHLPLLGGASLLGFISALPIFVIFSIFPVEIAVFLGFKQAQSEMVMLAVGSGFLSISVGLINGFWLGKRMLGHVLLLFLATSTPPLLYLVFARLSHASPSQSSLLLVVFCTNMLVCLGFALWYFGQIRQLPLTRGAFLSSTRELLPFIVPGLATGLLTPVSGVIIRVAIVDQMNWVAAGTVTALWRTSDIILSIANGILLYYYLPSLAIDAANSNLSSGFRVALHRVVMPAIILLFSLFVFQNSILRILYTEEFHVPYYVAALIWGGDALRMFSGLLLTALYAMHANRGIAVGEWLSQPLLALFLVLGAAGSLLSIGIAHVMTYLIFTCFNLWLLNKILTSGLQLRANSD